LQGVLFVCAALGLHRAGKDARGDNITFVHLDRLVKRSRKQYYPHGLGLVLREQ